MTRLMSLKAYVFHPSNLAHLRLPFSILLMPLYFFALAASLSVFSTLPVDKAVLVFFCLHFFMYPASNAFNSFYDRDEGSIGGLKSPPTVQPGLWWLALLFDLAGLLLALSVGIHFCLMMAVYCAASRSYSHPSVRLKARTFVGWLTVFTFQGAFAFLAVTLGLLGPDLFMQSWQSLILPAMCSSFLFGGAYPITQVYQHDEDRARGDNTLSLRLGVKGTFLFAFVMGAVGQVLMLTWVAVECSWPVFLFAALLGALPAARFSKWWGQVRKDESLANYESTTEISKISAYVNNVMFASLALFALL